MNKRKTKEEFEKYIINMEPSDPFIWSKRNSLSDDICDNIINNFEKDPQHWKEGVTISGPSENKKTIEIHITRMSQGGHKFWGDIDKILSENLTKALSEYGNFLYNETLNPQVNKSQRHNGAYKLMDTGYQLQKYTKQTGYYNWHVDSNPSADHFDTNKRMIAFIWYLNTVDEGGETMFYNGKIKAEKGKLILFPTTWTYLHRGNMPVSDNKYIITGWVFQYEKENRNKVSKPCVKENNNNLDIINEVNNEEEDENMSMSNSR